MSETIPQDGADPVVTDDTNPLVETTTDTTETAKPKEADKADPVARRFASMTAKLSASSATVRALEQQIQALQRPAAAAGQPAPEAQQAIQAEAERLYQQRITNEKVNSFHEAGKSAYSDWQEKCAALIEMGGDAQFADLLLDMPDGARVAAALADDPEEMERIAGLKTERARAIALGKYSAAMEAKGALAKLVSKAPPPVVPLRSGPVRTVFNESTATPEQLVEYYSKQERTKRGL